MKKNIGMLKSVSVFFSVLLIVILAGCKGKSSDSPATSTDSTYGGSSSQATISSTNAESVAVNSYADAYDAQGMTESLPNVGIVAGKSSHIGAGARAVKLVNKVLELKESSLSSKTGEPFVGTIPSDPVTINGNCGGSLTYTSTANITTKTFSMTLTFSNFCEDGVSINGSLSASGSSSTSDKQINMDFDSITVTGGESESITMDGSIDMNGTINDFTLVMDIIVQDNITSKTYWINDFHLHETYSESTTTTTIHMNGRFYDYDYGYVDLITSTDLQIHLTEAHPFTGVMDVTGQSSSTARLTFLSATTYKVEADANGNGVYEYSTGTLTW